jgi:hypothetical protein
MEETGKVSDALVHTAAIFKSAAEILGYVTIAVILVTVMALFVSGFYGIVHDGDDFGVDLGSHHSRGAGD